MKISEIKESHNSGTKTMGENESHIFNELEKAMELGITPNQIAEDIKDDPETYFEMAESDDSHDLIGALEAFCIDWNIPMDEIVQ